jgi:hypothetical protein
MFNGRTLVNYIYVGIWKEAVPVYLNILSMHSSRKSEQNHEKFQAG